MKQNLKKIFTVFLSLSMVFSIMQFSGVSVKAEAADGQIDTSEEGWETVRYYTNEDTQITSAQTKNERIADFFAGTQSMVWSADFKTGGSGLQGILTLNTSSQYYNLYIQSGKIKFELRGGLKVEQTTGTNYADGNWHTVTLEMTRNKNTVLSVDGTEVGKADSTACISDLTWTPEQFTIGGVTGYGSEDQTRGWAFSGSMRNIVLKKKIATPLPDTLFSTANPKDGLIQTGVRGALSEGSINLTYRLKEAVSSKVTLLTIGNSTEIYIDGASGKTGFSAGNEKLEVNVNNTALNTVKWHNVAVTLSAGTLTVYVDGEPAGSTDFAGTIDASSILCGADAYYSEITLYEKALSEEDIETVHEATLSSLYPDGTEKMDGYKKSDNREIYNSGFGGSTAYRIPAIVTSKKTGTVIASIDKRWNSSADIGVIDSVIRRSEDNGKTWGDVIPVIALSGSYAYSVDPALLVDNDENSPHYGRIYILADMWSQGTGFWSADTGTGYVEVNGKKYLKLTDEAGSEYTVRENGIVYNAQNEVTEYRVETEAEAPYTNQGELYKNGKRAGNIYKNSELTFVNTCYLWMTYSDDDGLTWSRPKDITPEVKSEWMKFCGTGPGMGIQTRSGRLIFPTYCTNAESIQSSFNVYSDDNGKTWHQGGSPNNGGDMETAAGHLTESCIVELDNGHLMQFMRSYNGQVTVSVSEDEGINWSTPTRQAGIKDPYCQMSAVHYPGKLLDPADGQEKEAIIFSNPGPDQNKYSPNGREYGSVRIAFVNEDDTLNWAYRKLIEEKRYIYSSLTVMNNGDIGLIYEHESYAMIGAAFTSFSPQYIMDTNPYENTPAPVNLTAKCLDKNGAETDELNVGGKIEVEVQFSQNVFAAGNVTLDIKTGNKVKEALLVGNTAADTLKFVYEIESGDAGTVVATADVHIKEGGAAETVYNVSLTDKPIVTKDRTVGTIFEESAGSGRFTLLPTDGMSASAGTAHSSNPASNVIDGNDDTCWHSKYDDDNASNGGRPKHWVTISLGKEYLVSGLQYLPRQDSLNGCVTKYQIEISSDGTNFTPVAQGSWSRNKDRKTAYLDGAVKTSYVRFRVLETGDDWATAAGLGIIGAADLNAATDKTEILKVLCRTDAYGESLNLAGDTKALQEAVKNARKIAGNADASAAEITAAAQNVEDAFSVILGYAKENLKAAIAKGNAKSEANYNLTTWLVYKNALDAAKQITEDAADEEALEAYINLLTAENNLAFSAEGDKNAEILEELKNQANLVIEQADARFKAENYTEASWAEYEKAYNRLKNALDNPTSAAVLKQYMAMLEEAKDILVEKPNSGTGEDPDKKPDTGTGDGSGSETNPEVKPDPDKKPESPLTSDKVYTVDKLKYKVTNPEKKTVSLVGTTNKKMTSLNVKKAVQIEGISCTVTEIGANAFKGCKKLKKVTIEKNLTKIGKQAFSGCSRLNKITFKGKLLTEVGKNAFKGISKKAVIKVPKAQKKKYKKLLSKKGQPKTVKIQ